MFGTGWENVGIPEFSKIRDFHKFVILKIRDFKNS